MLLPWRPSDWYPSALLRLDVTPDGRGRGRIVDGASFMELREQRRPRSRPGPFLDRRDGVTTSTTDLHPWHLATEPHAATAVGLRVPDVRQRYADDGEAGPRAIAYDERSRSWARIYLTPEPPYRVEQSGPRRLWDELAAAYRWWQDAGAPARDRWLVTVGPDGQRVELGP